MLAAGSGSRSKGGVPKQAGEARGRVTGCSPQKQGYQAHRLHQKTGPRPELPTARDSQW